MKKIFFTKERRKDSSSTQNYYWRTPYCVSYFFIYLPITPIVLAHYSNANAMIKHLSLFHRRCRKKFQSPETLWSWTIWAPELLGISPCCGFFSHLLPRLPLSPHWAVCPRCTSVHQSRGGCISAGILLGLVWSTGWCGTRLMFMARRSGASRMQLVGTVGWIGNTVSLTHSSSSCLK